MEDLFAYRLRVSDTKERAKLRSENAVATNRMNKKGRFNPEMQRMLGLRGGQKVEVETLSLSKRRVRKQDRHMVEPLVWETSHPV
jgi:hypothetical protein